MHTELFLDEAGQLWGVLVVAEGGHLLRPPGGLRHPTPPRSLTPSFFSSLTCSSQTLLHDALPLLAAQWGVAAESLTCLRVLPSGRALDPSKPLSESGLLAASASANGAALGAGIAVSSASVPSAGTPAGPLHVIQVSQHLWDGVRWRRGYNSVIQ